MIAMWWKEILIVLLCLLLALTGDRYMAERDAKQAIQTEYRLKLQEAETQRQIMRARSDEAILAAIEQNKINIRKAQDNAYKNFIARYGAACSLQPQPPMPRSAGAGTADNSQASDGAGKESMAPFVTACALDAAQITEWQQWATANRFPIQ